MSMEAGGDTLSLGALRELLEDDEAAIREVLARFLDTLAEARAGVTNAITANDTAGLAFHIHRFKSAAGQLGATECSRLCAVIYDLARAEPPMAAADAAELVRQLVQAMDRLQRDIEATVASLTH